MRCAASWWGIVCHCVFRIAISKLTVIVWYFFNDVYPPLHNGHSPLDPPAWWIRLFEGRPAPVEEEPIEETAIPDIGPDFVDNNQPIQQNNPQPQDAAPVL